MKTNPLENLMRQSKKTLILALLIFAFLFNLHAASIQCIWTGVEKIVAVGDLHGDYENFIKILKGTGLVDEGLHWTGGKTHFVQTGDIMDRGPDAKKIFDLSMSLEKEAEEAGGKVHMLIGNHEMMNIAGMAFDFAGYVVPQQYVSFISDKYREKKEKKFRKQIQNNASNQTDSDSSLDAAIMERWGETIRKDKGARREYIINFNKNYGKWIINHNTVIKINDIVFAHGGISEEYSTRKLKDINNNVRNELNDLRIAAIYSRPPNRRPRISRDNQGPLWYRDLAQKQEEFFKEEVDRILHNLSAKHMVIAHTPQRLRKGEIIIERKMSRFQGKIWIIDTGISKSYGGNITALIIEDGKFWVWE